jgi:hypothetical protein
MKKVFLVLLEICILGLFLVSLQNSAKALSYQEILQAQQGKVLDDITAVYSYPTGSLVNDNGTIYFISKTIKVPFTNWQAFVGLGYTLRDVVTGNLQNYTPSANYFITTANDVHPWDSWLLHNGTVYYSTQQGLIPVPSWAIFLNNSSQSKLIVQANKYDLSVLNENPNLPLLTDNDLRVTDQQSNATNNQASPPTATAPIMPSTNATTTAATKMAPPAATNTAPTLKYLQKQALIFQIDQGFGNGIVQNEDAVGLQRLITVLQAFQNKYEVYVTLSSRQADKTKLDWALGILAQNNIQFILEVYASDALSTGVDSVNNPYDAVHGRELSVDQLQQYKAKYGNMFAGVRTLEVFAENFGVLACQQQGVNWCAGQNLPSDRFYQKSFLEDYIKFAHNNGMFLLFTDWYWSAYHPWPFDQTVVNQPQNEQDLQNLVKVYPGTVVVAFANNEPLQESASKLNTWQAVVKPYVQYGAKGFGLSDQSWMCTDEANCPASTLANWATTAFSSGALVVQTEPYWYWWNFPVGAIGPQSANYTTDSQWANRGYATQNLATLATALGVSLTVQSPTTVSSSTDNSSCGNITIPSNLTPGQAFMASVVVNNTGGTTWLQNSSSNPNPYRLGASDFKQPPYTSSIWGTTYYELPVASVAPGGQTTFTINSVAPSTAGNYTFGWQMFEFGKAWFGPTCQQIVQVSPPADPTAITNTNAVCPSPGTSATVSWTAPSRYNSFYLRAKILPNPSDGSATVWNDSFTDSSYTFNTTPGTTYQWWVQTKDPQTASAGTALGTTFTCPTH